MKTSIEGTVRVNVYRVMDDAVETGVRIGLRRAHKYSDAPDEELIISEVNRAVMSELCECLIFDGPAGEQ